MKENQQSKDTKNNKKRSKLLSKYIVSLPPTVKWGFVISWIVIVAVLFLKLNCYPSRQQDTILDLISAIFLSFITASIFYLITSHYPKIKGREKTYGYVVGRIDYLLLRINCDLIDNLVKLMGKPFASTYPTTEEWMEFTNQKYPEIDWEAELSKIMMFTTEEIHRIIVVPNLDFHIYNLLLNLEGCSLADICNNIIRKKKDGKERKAITIEESKRTQYLYEPLIKQFLDYCKELEDYRDNHLTKYRKEINFTINPNSLGNITTDRN